MGGAYIGHFGRRGDYATLEDRRLENAPIPWDVSQSQTSVPSRSMAKVTIRSAAGVGRGAIWGVKLAPSIPGVAYGA